MYNMLVLFMSVIESSKTSEYLFALFKAVENCRIKITTISYFLFSKWHYSLAVKVKFW